MTEDPSAVVAHPRTADVDVAAVDQTPTITPQYQLAPGMPQPYIEPPSPQSQAHRWIRRMDWESLNRCVDRIKEGDTFNASWTSALGGVSAASLIGLVTVGFTTASGYALFFLGVIAVMSALTAVLIFKVEARGRKERVSHLDALKEEMAAMEKYMTTTGASAP